MITDEERTGAEIFSENSDADGVKIDDAGIEMEVVRAVFARDSGVGVVIGVSIEFEKREKKKYGKRERFY